MPTTLSLCIMSCLILTNEDFESGIYTANFVPGQSRSSVCIVVIDDDIREGNETFGLLLAIPIPTQKLNVSAGNPSFADVKIIGIQGKHQTVLYICLIRINMLLFNPQMILMMVWGYQFSYLLQWKKGPQCVYVRIVLPHHQLLHLQ